MYYIIFSKSPAHIFFLYVPQTRNIHIHSPSTHPLAMQIREKEDSGVDMTAIKIGNLSTSNVTSLIAEALGMEDNEDAVKTLAAIVHRKTNGNAFFV